MGNYKLILILMLITFVLVFTVQNVKIVEIQLLVWEFKMPRSLLIFTMIISGFLMGWFGRSFKRSE